MECFIGYVLSVFKSKKLYFFLVIILLNLVYQVNSGFGSWKVKYDGVELKMYSDPGGAYLESGIHLFKIKESTFPGHPGIINRILVNIVTQVMYVFSDESYYKSAILNYQSIAIITKITQSLMFIGVLFFVVFKLKLTRSKFLVLGLGIFIQPYFWIYFDAIAPEIFTLTGVLFFGYGLIKSNSNVFLLGGTVIAISKFMVFPLFIPFYFLFNRKVVLKGIGLIVAIYSLYFTQSSFLDFKNFWFLFSPAGISGGENILTHDLTQDLVNMVSRMFYLAVFRLKYLILSPQNFSGIYKYNIAVFFLLIISSYLINTKLIDNKFKIIIAIQLIMSLVLYLFRLEGHYLLPTILLLFILFIGYSCEENNYRLTKKFLLIFLSIAAISNFKNVVDYYHYNVTSAKEFELFYNDVISSTEKSVLLKRNGVNYYYPYQIGYTTKGNELPMYKAIKEYYLLSDDKLRE